MISERSLMYSIERGVPIMDPCENSSLIEQTFYPEPHKAVYYWEIKT